MGTEQAVELVSGTTNTLADFMLTGLRLTLLTTYAVMLRKQDGERDRAAS